MHHCLPPASISCLNTSLNTPTISSVFMHRCALPGGSASTSLSASLPSWPMSTQCVLTLPFVPPVAGAAIADASAEVGIPYLRRFASLTTSTRPEAPSREHASATSLVALAVAGTV